MTLERDVSEVRRASYHTGHLQTHTFGPRGRATPAPAREQPPVRATTPLAALHFVSLVSVSGESAG